MASRPTKLSDGIECTLTGTGAVFRLGEVLDGLPFTVRPTVAVVIAAANAAPTLPHLFARLPKVDEVALVDLGSRDDTARVARSLWPGLMIVDGTGMKSGDALTVGTRATSADIVILFNADGPGDLAELPRFLHALIDGADVAKGTRSADTTHAGKGLGNGALLRLANLAFGTDFSDLSFGYYAFWRSALERIVLDHDGVELDALLALRAARAGLLVAEIQCGESPRLDSQRTVRPLRDRLRLFRAIVAEYSGADERGLADLDVVSAA